MENGVFPKVKKEFEDFILVKLKINLKTEISDKWDALIWKHYKSRAIPAYAVHAPNGTSLEKLDFKALPSVEDMREFLKRNK